MILIRLYAPNQDRKSSMPSRKLRKEERELIAFHLVMPQFIDSAIELDVRESELAEKSYEHLYSEKERDLIAQLQGIRRIWFETSNSILVTTRNHGSATLTFNCHEWSKRNVTKLANHIGKASLLPKEHRGSRYSNDDQWTRPFAHGVSRLSATGDLDEAIGEFIRDRENLVEAAVKLRAETLGMLETLGTTKRIFEQWPAIAPVLERLNIGNDPNISKALTVPVEELNAKLGLLQT